MRKGGCYPFKRYDMAGIFDMKSLIHTNYKAILDMLKKIYLENGNSNYAD
jgi:hypothetical protein